MDFFRRLHQSYPPRPSPLSNSQESRDDRPRSHGHGHASSASAAAAAAATVAAANESRSRAESKNRPVSRYEYPSPSSSQSHLYSNLNNSRGSHRLRRDTAGAQLFPQRNHAHQHRRHASLETRQQAHAHRRNHSQPQTQSQTGDMREGRHHLGFPSVFESSFRPLLSPYSRFTGGRTCPVVLSRLLSTSSSEYTYLRYTLPYPTLPYPTLSLIPNT